jgi:hypothetical protein
MYSITQLKKGVRSPRDAIMEINSIYHQRGHEFNDNGINFLDSNWDVLIILDSCRYDVFKDVNSLPGNLSSRISRGGGTFEFLKGNISGREFRDTVYVTANPQFHYHREELDGSFHDVWNIWQHRWDDELQTVPPEQTTEAALEAIDKYPNKRLLIHYNQPHAPYIGPTGQELNGLTGNTLERGSENSRSLLQSIAHDLRPSFTAAEHRRAYVENLDIVLSAVEPLLEERDGRTVVTADHGQLLGECVGPIPIRYHGHRRGIHVKELVKVPWLVHESGKRPEITAEASKSYDDSIDGTKVVDRLHDLGYVK